MGEDIPPSTNKRGFEPQWGTKCVCEEIVFPPNPQGFLQKGFPPKVVKGGCQKEDKIGSSKRISIFSH